LAERIPQNLANHAKVDPPFHYVLLPTLLVTLVLAIVNVVRHYDTLAAWLFVLLTFAAVIAAFRIRLYSLRVQDRVIRLEERLRLSALLSEPLSSRIGELTESQLIAIRFASDEELPGLVEKALSSKMSNADIKKAITVWRADYFRV